MCGIAKIMFQENSWKNHLTFTPQDLKNHKQKRLKEIWESHPFFELLWFYKHVWLVCKASFCIPFMQIDCIDIWLNKNICDFVSFSLYRYIQYNVFYRETNLLLNCKFLHHKRSVQAIVIVCLLFGITFVALRFGNKYYFICVLSSCLIIRYYNVMINRPVI